VDTNIVVFSVDDAPGFVAALADASVQMGALDAGTVRAVTHLDVDRAGVEAAAAAAGEVLAAR
jgi:threonine aldolase